MAELSLAGVELWSRISVGMREIAAAAFFLMMVLSGIALATIFRDSSFGLPEAMLARASRHRRLVTTRLGLAVVALGLAAGSAAALIYFLVWGR